MYWMIRFVFQCVFYALVILAALMQVYHSDSTGSLTAVFVLIAIMGLILLWLEILQALQSWSKYKG
jgi:hypothetical protein